MHLFRVSLRNLQPSQPYINADKLARMMHHLAHHPIDTQEAVPIWRWGDRLVLTDGHTRAFAAWLMGHEKIMARWETDPLDWDAYQICVRWCEESNIYAIADLAGRVVSASNFRLLWLDKCLQMQGQLYDQRTKEPAKMD